MGLDKCTSLLLHSVTAACTVAAAVAVCRVVDEMPAALQLSGAEWAERYRFPKPGAGAPVVLQCRTQRRASWAAQLAADAGLHNVLVYKQVTQFGQGRASCLCQPRSMSGCLYGPEV